MEELHCGVVLEVEEPSLIDLSSHGCKQGMVELDKAHRCTFSVDRSVVERTHGSTARVQEFTWLCYEFDTRRGPLVDKGTRVTISTPPCGREELANDFLLH